MCHGWSVQYKYHLHQELSFTQLGDSGSGSCEGGVKTCLAQYTNMHQQAFVLDMQAGFQLKKIIPTRSLFSIVEALPSAQL